MEVLAAYAYFGVTYKTDTGYTVKYHYDSYGSKMATILAAFPGN